MNHTRINNNLNTNDVLLCDVDFIYPNLDGYVNWYINYIHQKKQITDLSTFFLAFEQIKCIVFLEFIMNIVDFVR